MDKPGTSKEPPKTSESPNRDTVQRVTGMRQPNNLSEWQLQAVLFKAKLTQYYDTFIQLGGDDIDQIMGCDENEFLEIMSLVGMASKPLHVRRLQRTLGEFSADRSRFLQEQLSFIGPPPILPSSATPTDNFNTALHYLTPSPLAPGSSEFSALALSSFMNPTKISPTSSTDKLSPITQTRSMTQTPIMSTMSSIGATANVMQLPSTSSVLMSLVSSQSSVPSSILSHQLRSPLSQSPDIKPESFSRTSIRSDLSSKVEQPAITEADLTKLTKYVLDVMAEEPVVEPRISKRQVQKHRVVLDVMMMPLEHPERTAQFRQFSAIYGRYDTKRNPDKPLTFHEALINEASSQICLMQPAMLTRRDRLFTLARLAVRLAGFPGRPMKLETSGPGERSTTPQSNVSNRSGCSTPNPDDVTRSHTASVEPSEEQKETSDEPSRKRKREFTPPSTSKK